MNKPVIVPPPVSRHPRSRLLEPMDRERGYSLDKAPSMQTPYMVMSLQANEAPTRHNVLAALYSWLIPAGYVIFPGTFTSLKNSRTLDNSTGGKIVQDTVQNVPLLPLAALCCIAGISGICWLWWTWQQNYVWLVRQVFL